MIQKRTKLLHEARALVKSVYITSTWCFISSLPEMDWVSTHRFVVLNLYCMKPCWHSLMYVKHDYISCLHCTNQIFYQNLTILQLVYNLTHIYLSPLLNTDNTLATFHISGKYVLVITKLKIWPKGSQKAFKQSLTKNVHHIRVVFTWAIVHKHTSKITGNSMYYILRRT